MASDTYTIKVGVDSDDALARLHELYEAAQPVAELLEVKRDWWPYVLGVGGWVAAIVAIIVR